MSMNNARDLVSFPSGDDPSDTLILGTHYNLTTLQHWNYTYYSNHTISNGSNCFLVFEPYTPYLLQNGTFLNSTSCYSPILPLGPRAITGLVFAAYFWISIMFTMINLRKHGRVFVPVENRFRILRRKSQWFWMLAVGACGLIGGIVGIDVDRYYLPELPLVLSNLFFYAMLLATSASVWESVRHWGNWLQMQMTELGSSSASEDSQRSKWEFCLNLAFYLFWLMSFIMIIPRPWTNIEKQRSPDQTKALAEPAATDIRFKVGVLFLLLSWLTTTYSFYHYIHLCDRSHPSIRREVANFRAYKNAIVLVTNLASIFYLAESAFHFSISPLNLDVNVLVMYLWGWSFIATTIFVLELSIYLDPNNSDLIRQRQAREQQVDAEIGTIRTPRWWPRARYNDQPSSYQEQVVRDITTSNATRSPQMERKSERPIELVDVPARMPADDFLQIGMVEGTSDNNDRNDRSKIGESGAASAVSRQKFRSMLDV